MTRDRWLRVGGFVVVCVVLIVFATWPLWASAAEPGAENGTTTIALPNALLTTMITGVLTGAGGWWMRGGGRRGEDDDPRLDKIAATLERLENAQRDVSDRVIRLETRIEERDEAYWRHIQANERALELLRDELGRLDDHPSHDIPARRPR